MLKNAGLGESIIKKTGIHCNVAVMQSKIKQLPRTLESDAQKSCKVYILNFCEETGNTPLKLEMKCPLSSHKHAIGGNNFSNCYC